MLAFCMCTFVFVCPSAADECRQGCSTAGSIDWFHTDWNLTFTADVCQAAKDMHAHTDTHKTEYTALPLLCCSCFKCLSAYTSHRPVFICVCFPVWPWKALLIFNMVSEDYLASHSWHRTHISQITCDQLEGEDAAWWDVCFSLLQWQLEGPEGPLKVSAPFVWW